MPWFKVDDGFHGHPKVVELSLSAVGLWTLAGSWSAKYLTDGAVSLRTVQRLGGSIEDANELVAVGLWLQDGEDYQFKDWSDYQPLKDAVEAERSAAQERMRKVRAKNKGVDENTPRSSGDVQANQSGTPADVRVTPSRPHPVPIPSPVVAPAVLVSAFDEAYSHWPKKVERKQAFDRFKVAAKRRDVSELVADIVKFGDAYAATTEKKFVPALGVWLNGERWTDELPTSDRGRVAGAPAERKPTTIAELDAHREKMMAQMEAQANA